MRLLATLVVLGCGKTTWPPDVDVQDGSATIAHVVIGRPCHARFGSVELSVDDQKLQSGGTTWRTEIHDGNPAFLRDDNRRACHGR